MSYEYDLGILGGGQLARMTAQAAQRMGLACLVLDPDAKSPAGQVSDQITGSLSDQTSIVDMLLACRAVTLENEFINAGTLRAALIASCREPGCMVPGPDTLGTINDKLVQRQTYARAGVPSPLAIELVGTADFDFLAKTLGTPFVIKARFGGYDGKGTRTIFNAKELAECSDLWQQGGWLAEKFVRFERELAVMVARSEAQTVWFPTVVTEQVDHVCDLVYPATSDAVHTALAAVDAIGGHGLFGVELFETTDGNHLVNEIAPRPHNSGHYSLDWGGVSQFEQLVRITMGWRLQEPTGNDTCMANLLGTGMPGDLASALALAFETVPGCFVHWYGKADARPGRKMGHINVVGKDCVRLAQTARNAFWAGWDQR